jgi:aspartate ammonia-lyase
MTPPATPTMTQSETRTEHDLLGALEVPAEAYYGIHTVRAVANFPLSGLRVHRELIRSLALVKKAAALANQRTGQLPENIACAISQACDEVVAGRFDDQFPLDPFQGGAGTSTNMNMNEVLANRAIEILGGRKGDYAVVHPNDHVNLSQSTNDAYPTAVKVAAIRLLHPVIEDMGLLQGALQDKEAEFAGVLKVGRTEMQDAVPVTLGQEFSAYAQAVQRDWWRLHVAEEKLRQVNLGGTAVGTGLCADVRYVLMVVDVLRDLTGLGLARSENMMDVTQNVDVFVEVSGLLKTAAVTLAKIAGDLRLLSSGPRAGIGEIALPEQQAGSSIMPGKVNPVIPEAVTQVAYQVMANDMAITLAAHAGQLDLNAFLPLIAHNLFQQLDLLHNGVQMLMERCIRGIEARPERCRAQVEQSFGLVTAVAPYIGYDAASEVAREAAQTGRSVRDVLLERGLFTAHELEIVLSPQEMTKPGIPGAKQLKERGRTPQARPQGPDVK